MARKKAKAKGPSDYALSLIGQSGEFLEPENHPNLEGMELKILEVDKDEQYTVELVGQGRGFRRGQLFLVPRSEFVTTNEKKRQAGY